jgi:hypothetical protein
MLASGRLFLSVLAAALFDVCTRHLFQLGLLKVGQQDLLLGFLPHVLFPQLFTGFLGSFPLRHEGKHLRVLKVIKFTLLVPNTECKEIRAGTVQYERMLGEIGILFHKKTGYRVKITKGFGL